MAKLLVTGLFCLLSIVACSAINSSGAGNSGGEEREGADPARQVQATYQRLESSMSSRVERSCLACTMVAFFLENRDGLQEISDGVFDAEERLYMTHFITQLDRINSNDYGGAGIPQDDIDEICTGLTKDMISQMLSMLSNIEGGRTDLGIPNDLTPYAHSEVVERYRVSLDSENDFSCLDRVKRLLFIALNNNPTS